MPASLRPTGDLASLISAVCSIFSGCILDVFYAVTTHSYLRSASLLGVLLVPLASATRQPVFRRARWGIRWCRDQEDGAR